jgi:hypothetical protein
MLHFFFTNELLTRQLEVTPPFPALSHQKVGASVLEKRDNKIFLKVKLLLVHTGIWRWCPQMLNTRARQFAGSDTPFGLVHAGLQIGPYIIDWNKDELITPHRLKSNSPLLLVDLDLHGSTIELTTANLALVCDSCE